MTSSGASFSSFRDSNIVTSPLLGPKDPHTTGAPASLGGWSGFMDQERFYSEEMLKIKDAAKEFSSNSNHKGTLNNDTDDDLVIKEIHLLILQILNHVFDSTIDYHVSTALALFKSRFERESKESPTSPGKESTYHGGNLLSLIEGLFEGHNQSRKYADIPPMPDLDGNNGRTLVAAMLALVPSNDLNIVSAALNLLFRHFSKRQELIKNLKHMQLLIHSNEVQLFDEDQRLLTIIKPIIRRFKTSGVRSERELDVITKAFNKFAMQLQQIMQANAKEQLQSLLLNIGAHEVAMSFLAIPVNEKSKITAAHTAIHKFLHELVAANANAQTKLAKHKDIFIDQIIRYHEIAVETLILVFKDNSTLCASLVAKDVASIANAIHTGKRSCAGMRLLRTLVKPGKLVLRAVALMVLELMSSAGYENLLLLFSDARGKADLVKLMSDSFDQDPGVPLVDYEYHLMLIELLAICGEEKHIEVERICQSIMSADDVQFVVCHVESTPKAKLSYLNFLNNCYLDTKVYTDNQEIHSTKMWQILDCFAEDLVLFCDPQYAVVQETDLRRHYDELREYIDKGVMFTLTYYFRRVKRAPDPLAIMTVPRQQIFSGLLRACVDASLMANSLLTKKHIMQAIETLREVSGLFHVSSELLKNMKKALATKTGAISLGMLSKSRWQKKKNKVGAKTTLLKRFILDESYIEAKEIVEKVNVHVSKLAVELSPGIDVELAILSRVLQNPTGLERDNLQITKEEFLRSLIHQTRLLPPEKVELQVGLLVVFRSMIHPVNSTGWHQDAKRRLLSKYAILAMYNCDLLSLSLR